MAVAGANDLADGAVRATVPVVDTGHHHFIQVRGSLEAEDGALKARNRDLPRQVEGR